MLPKVTSDLQARQIATIHKRLGAAQGSEQLMRREYSAFAFTRQFVSSLLCRDFSYSEDTR